MPVWLDRLAVGVIVGGALLFVLARVVQRVTALSTRRPLCGAGSSAACGCGAPPGAARHGGARGVRRDKTGA